MNHLREYLELMEIKDRMFREKVIEMLERVFN